MRVVFLGTAAVGEPMIGQPRSPWQPTPRTSFTLAIQPNYPDPPTLLVDAGPELRGQWARWTDAPACPDAVIITHGVFDHMAGLYALLFCPQPTPVYAIAHGIAQLQGYAQLFPARGTPEALRLRPIEIMERGTVELFGVPVETFPLRRLKIPDIGLIVRHGGRVLAHLSDTTADIDTSVRESIHGCDLLVVNAPAMEDEPYHIGIPSAVALGRDVQAKRLALTHIGSSISPEFLRDLQRAEPWILVPDDGSTLRV